MIRLCITVVSSVMRVLILAGLRMVITPTPGGIMVRLSRLLSAIVLVFAFPIIIRMVIYALLIILVVSVVDWTAAAAVGLIVVVIQINTVESGLWVGSWLLVMMVGSVLVMHLNP